MTTTQAIKILRQAVEAREALVQNMTVDTIRDANGVIVQMQVACPLCGMGFAAREFAALPPVLRLHLDSNH